MQIIDYFIIIYATKMTFYLFLCNQLPIHPDVNRVIFDLYYNTFPRPEGCNIYYYTGNVVYGDIVIDDKYDMCTKSIYDGNKLVNARNQDNFQLFKIIYNNVPIDYWVKKFQGVYFPYTQDMKEQCIKGITYGLLANKLYGFYTTFIYNNKQYRIIFNHTGCQSGSYRKYTFQSAKTQWKPLSIRFQEKLEKEYYNFYIAPEPLYDNYTIVMNAKL